LAGVLPNLWHLDAAMGAGVGDVFGAVGSQTSAAPPPELIDELDQKGASNELVQDWAAREAKNMARLAQRHGKCGNDVPPGQPLNQELRKAALQFLTSLVELSGLPQSTWFDAVLLLDLCYLSGRVGEEVLPSVCTVLVTVLGKNESATSTVRLADLSILTTRFAMWMSGMGYYVLCQEVTKVELRKQETAVLSALDWQLNWPSVRTWLSAFCDRFDVLLRHTMTSNIEWIFAQSIFSASSLVAHHPASATMAPQRMANGLLCIFLVVARMVPLAALRPAHLSQEEWEERFCKSQCMGAPPSSSLPPAWGAGILRFLTIVTGCEFRTLVVDAHLVVEAMLDVTHQQHAATQVPGAKCWLQHFPQDEHWWRYSKESSQPQAHQQEPDPEPELGRRLVAVC